MRCSDSIVSGKSQTLLTPILERRVCLLFLLRKLVFTTIPGYVGRVDCAEETEFEALVTMA